MTIANMRSVDGILTDRQAGDIMEKIFVGYAQIVRRVEPDEDKQRVHDQSIEESSTADVASSVMGDR